MKRDNLFRQEAMDHYLREAASVGIVSTRTRIGWTAIVLSVALVAATVAYAILMADVVHALHVRLRQ